ncbi:head GIN domain-containing protein [Draconibacterium sp. IB214405]|uniref:head GIN domain-containing protein n=1 Tax=Draconibacterium sp. IB214405 TaxID=3097352 RepID=UPI002A0B0AAE|nr:head GIN domain-containing protein [Draconibacterium sp. IB214405]MDX8340211.1 head GIN domain-containing protein [Draconibacterium sp. IB214405]
MKTALLFTLSILLSVQLFAQDDDDWDVKKYDIDDFSSIYLEGGYKVLLSQGDHCALTIKTTDEDVLDHLEVENWGDELRLVMDRDFLSYERIRLYITFKNLDEITAQGGLKLDTDGYLDLNDLFIHVEGGAKIEMNLKAEDIEIVGEGGVLVELDGVADRLDVKLSGAGHVDAGDIKVNDASFKIEGVGTGSVHAIETLYAKIEGVGKVRYTGNPKVTRDIEGLGSVKRD